MQTASDSIKKGKSSDTNGIRAEDTKTCDEMTKEMTGQIDLQRSDEARRLLTRNMDKNMYKMIHRKTMRKKSEITARFALCQRCTNSSQHSLTTDFTTGLTVHNQKTTEGFDVHTKRWIILRHADCLNRNVWSGNQNVGRDSGLSWRHLTR